MAVSLCIAAFSVGEAQSQESAETLFAEAIALDSTQQSSPEALSEIARILDKIVLEHGSSDLAVHILLRDTVEGYDTADFYARLEQSEGSEALTNTENTTTAIPSCLNQSSVGSGDEFFVEVALDPRGELAGLPQITKPTAVTADIRRRYLSLIEVLEKCSPFQETNLGEIALAQVSATGLVSLHPVTSNAESVEPIEDPKPTMGQSGLAQLSAATEVDEKSLNLSKQDVRDIQARLSVLGYDPNGIDGVIGRGTRSALSNWQQSIGAGSSGFLSGEQHATLKAVSEDTLSVWLQTPDNETRYNPPPPIAIGPGNLPGRWRSTTNCGRNSRVGKITINDVMSIQHTGGNRYAGRLKNSLGQTGKVNATLSGRTLSGTVSFGLLLGKVSFSARIDDHALVAHGRDSNGCSFYSRKS